MTQSSYSDLWLLPKLKSPLKGKRFQTISDSGKYNGADDGDWENCVRSQGAYFEGDWGIIVLCTVFLVSASINVSSFHSTWLDTFWTDPVGLKQWEERLDFKRGCLVPSRSIQLEGLSSRATSYCLGLGSSRSRAWGKVEPWVQVVYLGSDPREQEWRAGERNMEEGKANTLAHFWVCHQHRWLMHREPYEMPPRTVAREWEGAYLSTSLHPWLFKIVLHIAPRWAPHGCAISITYLETSHRTEYLRGKIINSDILFSDHNRSPVTQSSPFLIPVYMLSNP